MRIISIPFLAFVVMSGCATIDDISDDDLARDIRLGAKNAVAYGLRLAIEKEPEKAEVIRKSAELAGEILKKNVIPAFSGAGSGEVLRSAVETALAQLSAKLTPKTIAAVQIAIDIVSVKVKLPKNPAEKIDERTRKALVGLFNGMSEGVDLLLASPGPTTSSTPPATLVWP